MKKLQNNNNKNQSALHRQAVQRMIHENVYDPKKRSWDVLFKKTPEDKIGYANLKMKHKAELQSKGFNPKKRMNAATPFFAVIW